MGQDGVEEEAEKGQTEYYAALVNAWLRTKFERDKGLMTLSSGGIGLVVTVISIQKPVGLFSIWVLSGTVAFFLLSLISVVFIFSRNSRHLERVASGEEDSDCLLRFLDIFSVSCFLVGVILFGAFGIGVLSVG